MNQQYYQMAIDILMTQDVNYKKIVIELAKKHPDIFIECMGQKQILTQLEFEILNILKRDHTTTSSPKIEAIKHHRTVASSSLKEAKDAVEDMQVKFIELGYLPQE